MPTNLKPYFYELEIRPYIGPSEVYGNLAFTFEGKMTMHFTCLKSTNKIIFHQLNLNIDAANLELNSPDDTLTKLDKNILFDAKKQFVIINLSRNCVEKANYKLVVPYTGHILSNLYGFYRGSYVYNNQTY